MADNYEELIKTAVQNKDHALVTKVAQKCLETVNKVHLNIAITGESGSGKSSLVNALRGIDDDDTEGAAKTGVTETTMEPKDYPYPEMPNITIWDLPGIGTTNFPADEYKTKMKFDTYDFFIIVSSERFRENDAKLAQEIQKMKKHFYFVRSKIDHSIRDAKRKKAEDVLDSIRKYCIEELQKLHVESPKIFLVSSREPDQYEFNHLKKTLVDDLPELQRNALVLALPITSLDDIENKKNALGSKIKWFTLASTAVAAVPVPGLSDAVDVGMVAAFTQHAVNALGLSPKSLRRLSEVSGVSLTDLKGELKSSLSGVEITTEVVVVALTGSGVYITAMVVEDGIRFVPLVGTVLAMGISFVTTYCAMTYILKSLTEDAERVFIKAWKKSSV